jgi:C4-dicarboxylate transporter
MFLATGQNIFISPLFIFILLCLLSWECLFFGFTASTAFDESEDHNKAMEVGSHRQTRAPAPYKVFPFINIILILLDSMTKGILYRKLVNTLKHSQRLYAL